MSGSIFERISISEKIPDVLEYWELFNTTGWNDEYNFTIQDLARAIEKSWYSCSLYESGKLIGFGRVISDGIQHALIADIIVHPDYQGNGLGSMLLDKLVCRCKGCNIRDIQLFAAKGRYLFYERFGFEKRPEDAPGMQLRYIGGEKFD